MLNDDPLAWKYLLIKQADNIHEQQAYLGKGPIKKNLEFPDFGHFWGWVDGFNQIWKIPNLIFNWTLPLSF